MGHNHWLLQTGLLIPKAIFFHPFLSAFFTYTKTRQFLGSENRAWSIVRATLRYSGPLWVDSQPFKACFPATKWLARIEHEMRKRNYGTVAVLNEVATMALPIG
jgi:hypothetical protein